jgi:hypothetical protein
MTWHRADEQLDSVERNQPLVARAAWAVSTAAAGVASHPGVQAAARVTANVSADLVRAAVPVGEALGKGALDLAWQVRHDSGAQACCVDVAAHVLTLPHGICGRACPGVDAEEERQAVDCI